MNTETKEDQGRLNERRRAIILPTLRKVTQVRSEYTSARHIWTNLSHRVGGSRYCRYAGYLPAQIDYETLDGGSHTICVRDYDVRFLDRISSAQALEYVNRIHLARAGHAGARQQIGEITSELHGSMAVRFTGSTLVENQYVVPYTSEQTYSQEQISHKGAVLLDLSQRGLATADFTLFTADAYRLPVEERTYWAMEALRNLEVLSGRKLGDPDHPLLIAMRCAMPSYIPGFMPTYLNVGLTPQVLPGLPARYGTEGAARIWLNNRKTLLEEADPEAYRVIEPRLRPGLSLAENSALACEIEEAVARRNPGLIEDAHQQVLFFLARAIAYYESHLDTLRCFMGKRDQGPTMIFQRMVCSVLDDESYAGVLYSRHSRTGQGVHLQYARTIFGEDLMTGRMVPSEATFQDPEEARDHFPAVYHFWDRLEQLEDILKTPVMVEFTGVHGTFTLLQLNEAELSGIGMLTAVIDLHRKGRITAERVRSLIRPYHIRQIESDAIDPNSLARLEPFARGIPVLPRSAVSGRICFSGARAREERERSQGEKVILARARFYPTDAISMQAVQGICSVSPAAIHVVTTAQNLGIPALLNLEEEGVRIDEEAHTMVNADGLVLREGEWVTISSSQHTLYRGQAQYAPARLLRIMAGEDVPLSPTERPNFLKWAEYYGEYRLILENADVSEFNSLQDLGHAIRYGRLKDDPTRAAAFVNLCFDLNESMIVERLLDTTLGTHLVNFFAFQALSPERRVRLLKGAATTCMGRKIGGYQAGSFVVGSLVAPGAPVSFWKSFSPDEVAFLVSEWLQHQKYLALVTDVGEQKVSRARDRILSKGLNRLALHRGILLPFVGIKLARVDLLKVLSAIPAGADPQTNEVVELLSRPYGFLFDFDKSWSIAPLRRMCEQERIPLPRAEDV